MNKDIRSTSMNKNLRLLKKTLDLCVREEKKLQSDYFKEYLSSFYDNIYRHSVETGYLVRCAENKLKTNKLGKPDKKIQNILKSHKSKYEKIGDIVYYLGKIYESVDYENETYSRYYLSLKDKLSKYSLFSFKDTQTYLFGILLFGIKLMIEHNAVGYFPYRPLYAEDLERASLGWGIYGYLFKLGEELIKEN